MWMSVCVCVCWSHNIILVMWKCGHTTLFMLCENDKVPNPPGSPLKCVLHQPYVLQLFRATANRVLVSHCIVVFRDPLVSAFHVSKIKALLDLRQSWRLEGRARVGGSSIQHPEKSSPCSPSANKTPVHSIHPTGFFGLNLPETEFSPGGSWVGFMHDLLSPLVLFLVGLGSSALKI